jgi:hypothetical protein
LVLLTLLLMTASAVVSFSRIELTDLYQQMGYSQAQVQMMTQLELLRGRNVGYLSAAAALPMLVYMLWVKHFFRNAL